ncbi:MAG: hypothetical protein IKD77_00480 [Bacilli bacterium]|nr:hypothetical protein [Bacilli bacterium]
MRSSDEFIDNIYLTYDKILFKLRLLGIKTKNGKEITHADLRQAVLIMLKKHPTCRWRSTKIKSKHYFILYEGFLWLVYVYFQNEKSQINADIYFFETRIKEYEKELKLNSKNLFSKDIAVDDLEKYFKRVKPTIKRVVYKMLKVNSNYRYMDNEKYIITKEGIEWLCKNCFKQKYLELLEDYKMELTEKYIEAGYLYDYFFGLN